MFRDKLSWGLHELCNRQRPFIRLDSQDQGAVLAGVASCDLGHRLAGDEGEAGAGSYVQWRWDGNRLVVENDRFGQYPLFYGVRGRSICVSPDFERVAREVSAGRLDLDAMAVYFRLGHFVGDDTAFDDVKALPPGSRLVWELGGTSIESRAARLPGGASSRVGFDEAVDTYIDLFAASIKRRVQRNATVVVPLSGGRDSRHILLELCKQGRPPDRCLTVKYRPPAANIDAQVASTLCKRLGIKHVILDRIGSFFEGEVVETRLSNHSGGGHGWAIPLALHTSGCPSGKAA